MLMVTDKIHLTTELRYGIIILIETGLNTVMSSLISKKRELREVFSDPKRQADLWEEFAGKWEDSRETSEIIQDIIESRSRGREFSL